MNARSHSENKADVKSFMTRKQCFGYVGMGKGRVHREAKNMIDTQRKKNQRSMTLCIKTDEQLCGQTV